LKKGGRGDFCCFIPLTRDVWTHSFAKEVIPMARKKSEAPKEGKLSVKDYRHRRARRKNIPPAGLAAEGEIRETPQIEYSYNLHLLG